MFCHVTHSTAPLTGTEDHAILAVKVTNRADCCGDRLNGFYVYIDGNECASNVQIKEAESKMVECNGVGSTLKIALKGASRVLTLCEVEVLVMPPPSGPHTPGPFG